MGSLEELAPVPDPFLEGLSPEEQDALRRMSLYNNGLKTLARAVVCSTLDSSESVEPNS